MSDCVEKLFRKALEEASVEPPARVWAGIEAHFALRRRRRRLFWYGGVAAAVALLVAAVGLSRRWGPEGALSPAPLATAERMSIRLEDNRVAAIMSSAGSIPPFERRASGREVVSPMEGGAGIALALAGDAGRGELKETGGGEAFIPIVDGESLRNQREYARLLREEAAARGEAEAVTPTKTRESKADAGPERAEEEKRAVAAERPARAERAPRSRERGRFSVGGYVSPGYTSGAYRQSNTTSRSTQFSSEQMSGLFNVTGGVSFAVRPTKRISIETGVGYSRMGQKTEDMPVYTPPVTMSAGGEASNVQVATPLGSVRSKSQATVYTMDANIALKGADMPEGSIEQVFDAIEVPLLFRYRLNDNKVRFSVMGGFGASFVVRNETRLRYEGVSESMGETDGIRKFNVSTNVGLGVEYPLSRAVSFRVEPGFKYYLQSLSKGGDIDFKPYSFTFSTGIGITF